MIIDNEKPWARIVLGVAGISYVAYCVHTGRYYPGPYTLSGIVVWTAILLSIAQLFEWIWQGLISKLPRRSN